MRVYYNIKWITDFAGNENIILYINMLFLRRPMEDYDRFHQSVDNQSHTCALCTRITHHILLYRCI